MTQERTGNLGISTGSISNKHANISSVDPSSYVRKCGRTVEFLTNVRLSGDIGVNTAIFTLPYKPSTTAIGFMSQQGAVYQTEISANGVVSCPWNVSSAAKIRALYFGSYLTND